MPLKETDLIYEGIATLQFIFSLLSRFCKETDLIYEGIATAGICLPDSVWTMPKETDLIYEGIATQEICDSITSLSERKKLTWFTKGLRRTSIACILSALSLKETDLIYEGIATLARPVDHNTVFSKETDLIYEGIATPTDP